MKIGIITFHNTNNYGATLQAFALSKYISNMGYDVEIIDYNCEYKKDMYSIISFGKGIGNTFKSIYMAIPKKKKIDFLKDFLKSNSNLSIKEYNSLEELDKDSQNWNVLITGSDQVWNYKNTGLDEAYFLNFGSENMKRLSYAASFGLNEIEDAKKDKISKLLLNLDNISVRERTGVLLAEELTKTKVTEAIDPTFLLTRDEWSSYAGSIKNRYKNEPYILLYTMKYPNETLKIADTLSKKTNFKIINVFRSPKDYFNNKIKTELPNMPEFLSLVKSARYVVTDSFHGTAMAINFGIGVLAYCPQNGDTQNRLVNLLKLANLESNIVIDYNENFEVPQEKYEYKESLKRRIDESKKYLKAALKTN